VQAADFFVALRGERFDGNAFVGDAFARGARGALVDLGYSGPMTDGVVQVPDTTRALQDLAHAVRTASKALVIAITGSAGKTTTKEAIATLLGTRYRVVRNKGNLNNHIGLPLSLFDLRIPPDIAVMELGMNHAGEIARLVEIAEPEVRVWTNVGDAHLEFFASAEAIADAKAEILRGANASTLLVCNADDRRVMERTRQFPGRIRTFGIDVPADVRAHDVRDRGVAGMEARVATPAGERLIVTPLLGRGNLANVLAAMTVALEFGVPLDTIAETTSRLRPADRRGAVRPLAAGVTLIDDSYNSSPSALRRALDVVARETGFARKLAVIGEMLELGQESVRLHEACGASAAAAGLAVLITVGGAPARALADAAVRAGMPAGAVMHVENSELAADAIVAALKRGDLVLVKGSRGIRTDIVADHIVAELG
jgi:UDP-N-acetylmuramoyl-tripeptide--D-alanyl-D-alanine ligase